MSYVILLKFSLLNSASLFCRSDYNNELITWSVTGLQECILLYSYSGLAPVKLAVAEYSVSRKHLYLKQEKKLMSFRG